MGIFIFAMGIAIFAMGIVIFAMGIAIFALGIAIFAMRITFSYAYSLVLSKITKKKTIVEIHFQITIVNLNSENWNWKTRKINEESKDEWMNI